MKVRSRLACISAAVAAFVYGGATAGAADLTWDVDPGTAGVQDGSGNWETATANWFDGVNNVTWNNATPDSAFLGNDTNVFVGGTPNNIDMGAAITVQNLVLGTGADGQIYNISDFGGSLTLAGNVTKTSSGGNPQLLLINNGLTLAAGDHVFALRDTGGDAAAELTVNATISGAGGVTMNNGAYEAWGTLAFNPSGGDNTYTGATNISHGRLVITTSNGLGATSAGTTISNSGSLSIGGANNVPLGNLNIAEPITITRDTYVGGEFERYPAALIVNNNGAAQTHTISGPLVVDSADARIAVATNTLVISSNITQVGATPRMLSFVGDYSGFVQLTGNNSGLLGGIRLVSAAEVQVSSHDNLGGASAPITFGIGGNGDGTLGIMGGFMTDFGTHVVNYSTFSGGLDVPTGQVFNISQNLGTAGSGQGTIGKRGDGTLNLSGTNNLTGGQSFFDSGTVSITGSTTLQSLHLRSPVLNIPTGGVVTLTSQNSSFGESSNGTNGGPDKAIINITGTGQLISNWGGDMFLSDGANTEGTINLKDSGTLTVSGLLHVARNAGGKGTINQEGGTFNLTRNGNFTLVLGSRNGLGTYNLSGGTMNSNGEFYVGQGPSGVGVFNMSGGTVNLNHWFVVGREGGSGDVHLTGGIFNKNGPGTNTEIDVDGGVGPSTMTISNSAEYRANNGDVRVGVNNGSNGTLIIKDSGKLIVSLGEFWVGQSGGSTGVANLQDSASVSVNNNWVAIGRAGGNGTLNLSGNATFAKSGGGNFIVADNSIGNATVAGNSSITDTNEFWVGQAGNGNGTLTIQDSGSVSVGNWVAIGRGGGNGVVNMSGGTFNKTGGGNFIISAGGGSRGLLNQTGGVVSNTGSETWISEGSTRGVWDMSGGSANLAVLDVGHNGGGNATLTVSGAANLTATNIRVGPFDSVNGTVNLNGGTINANQVSGGGGGSKIFNFNGGTLKARVDNATFMQGLSSANVQNGGAIIDSNGFSVTAAQALVAGGTGGLTKNGTGTLTVNGANTYTGPTTVNAGTLNIGQSSRTSSALVVANGAVARVTPRTSGVKTLQVGTLNLNASGTLDLSDNDLVVDNGSFTAIQNLVISGFGTSGPGIISSTSDGTQIHALFDNALVGASDWNGGAIGANAVVGKYTYFGDANIDGQVTGDDYGVIDANLNTTPAVGLGWLSGDMNLDGSVTGDDYGVVDANLGLGVGNPLSPSSLSAGSLSAVPEPASIGILAAAGMMFGARRRRRVNL